jgi:hypothetical protein
MKDPGKEQPYVASAIHDARIATDSRGLMKLKDARRWLAARKTFSKGEGEMVDGTFVLESDRTWAALLSLEDAAELVREATRLEWRFHVRGKDNLALHERYGDEILPWLGSRLKNGVLYNQELARELAGPSAAAARALLDEIGAKG